MKSSQCLLRREGKINITTKAMADGMADGMATFV